MLLEDIRKVDNTMRDIIKKVREKETTDEEFSKSKEIVDMAYAIIDIYQSNGIKTTYNNLTNMNNHILVKILNYNGFFDKTLSADIRNELKTIKLI